jgi:predicted tellurium resistance membrane protein TerC
LAADATFPPQNGARLKAGTLAPPLSAGFFPLDFLNAAADLQILGSFLTLTVLEIVLGIDNLVFVAIATKGLPADRAILASRIGLAMAVIMRLTLLFSMVWLTRLTEPFLQIYGQDFSISDLILISGGLFLIYKGAMEIHEELDPEPGDALSSSARSFWGAICKIAVFDIVFSLDSVLAAIGMADEFAVMALAVIVAVAMMILAARPISLFIRANPTVKMLALSFLLLIGATLVADGFGHDIPKGFVYSAVGFSLMVEALNQWARRKRRDAVENAEQEASAPLRPEASGSARPAAGDL